VCSHYELTAGVREVIGGSDDDSPRYRYWVKVLNVTTNTTRDDEQDHDDSATNAELTKILIIFGTVDAIGLILFAGLCVYYFFGLRERAVDKHVTEEGEAAGHDHDRGATEPDSTTNGTSPIILMDQIKP
jgi:hypothetical protein